MRYAQQFAYEIRDARVEQTLARVDVWERGWFWAWAAQQTYANAASATYSPDGAKLAYNPIYEAFNQWKNYRGGTNSTIWIFALNDNSSEKVPQPTDRANDAGPMWIGDTIYFRSDRNGEFNIFSYNPRTKAFKQLTDHKDFPVISASAGSNAIIYEQAGQLHTLDLRSGKSTRLVIGVAADLEETRPRYVKAARYTRDAALSPTGARAVFEYRGEGVLYLSDRTWDGRAVLVGVGARSSRNMQLVPADGGQPTVIREGRVAQMTARVSPDAKWLAFASDESGQMQVYVSPIPATGRQWQISAAGGEFPQWSGDGRELFFIAPDGSVMSAAITLAPAFDFSPPRLLFKTGLAAGELSQRFVATADGKHFIFNMLREGDRAATITTLRVLLNWTDGLTQ